MNEIKTPSFHADWIRILNDYITCALALSTNILLWKILVNAFNALHPNAPVILQQISDMESIESTPCKKMPDMAVFSNSFILNGHFNSLDWLDLTLFIGTLKKNEYYPHFLLEDRNERIWCIASYLISFLTEFDKGIFKKYGEEFPKFSFTWDDFLESALMLKKK